ncbi:hypothetical protein B2J93_8024 [Marssonina coronariae]|uniref:Uncharacterized protein n=1 Tax=Diplocarpon coronariae TaxID=2795749 RepID=A0A218ZC13_9HELO|nr:hypothetical protein B2J93_8024 [Marssonina coronariae]
MEAGWVPQRRDRDAEWGSDEHEVKPLSESLERYRELDEFDEVGRDPTRGSAKSTLWVILMTLSTLNGRWLLRGGFAFPFYFTLLIQLGAYAMVAVTLLLVQLGKLRTKFPRAEESRSWFETFLIGFRILLSSSIASLGMLCGARALLHCPNLPVLAMLPIVTYVFDSFLFRLAYVLRIVPRDQSISVRKTYKVILVLLCAFPPVLFDYRLDTRGLLFALAGFALCSLSRVAASVGPRIESKGDETWESPLRVHLLAGLPPMIFAGIATSKFENVNAASQLSGAWSLAHKLQTLGPGVLLHILFSGAVNSAYPFTSRVHVGGALEEPTESATDAVASTLQAGFWTVIFGVLGQDNMFIDWIQVISFTLVYVVCVGPAQIGYYPPRLLNLITRLFRRRQLPLHAEPWQFSFFLATTTITFALLISCNVMFWVNTVAYNRNSKTWLEPSNLPLDTLYRAPNLRSFDVIIAHSEGDSIETIARLIQTFTSHPFIIGLNPRVTVYSKDPTLNLTASTAQSIKGLFGGDLSIQSLRNTGGITATFLHHILSSWAFMPVQTLFLSTSTPDALTLLPLRAQRLTDYFLPMGFPVPDAIPKTGFLNLGEQESCWCGACFDSLGWEDSFHLIPSMWSAARPGSPACESVLLTHGNNFIASAARIRGVKRDVWEMLHDGLVNEDMGNAWAHKKEKMPLRLAGEEGRGRYAEGQVYGRPDDLARPYLGLTVERLWAVLLQCSRPDIAWGCPSLEIGWRSGGRRDDCGCTE